MTEPTRLLSDESTPEEATLLLRSLSAPEGPSAAKQAELARQLANLAPPAAAASAGTALWVKAALLVGALGVAGTWAALKLRASEPTHAPQALASAAPVAQPASAAPETSDLPPPAPSALELEAPREAVVGSTHAKPSARDSLAEEEALLEQARRAATSSPSQALGLLRQYQRRFPAGQLSAERMFLSVDVLTRLGNKTAARKQADALIRAFPSSVYAQQVKTQSSNP
jgi:hypothetical protein